MQEVNHYPDELKSRVVQEVMAGLITKEECRRKYGIKGKSTVLRWIRNFHGNNGEFPKIKMRKKEEVSGLKDQIRALKKELDYERLRSTGLEEMINIAEEELKIPIRKKSGAKQSKK
jgi:transposase